MSSAASIEKKSFQHQTKIQIPTRRLHTDMSLHEGCEREKMLVNGTTNPKSIRSCFVITSSPNGRIELPSGAGTSSILKKHALNDSDATFDPLSGTCMAGTPSPGDSLRNGRRRVMPSAEEHVPGKFIKCGSI